MSTAPGVYAVVCTKSGNAYVGASGDCKRRLRQHQLDLREQRHICAALMREFNLHGELYFEFRFLERVVDPKALRERERHWIREMGTLNTHGRKSAR